MDDEIDFWLPSEWYACVKREDGEIVKLKRNGKECAFILESVKVTEHGNESNLFGVFRELGTENRFLFMRLYSYERCCWIWHSADCSDVFMNHL
jgi:hypothetical protein